MVSKKVVCACGCGFETPYRNGIYRIPKEDQMPKHHSGNIFNIEDDERGVSIECLRNDIKAINERLDKLEENCNE